MATQDRYEREREFHDERFARDGGERRSSRYYSVAAESQAYYRQRLDAHSGPGRAVLEYGCGTGSAAFDLAEAGAEVVAIDISPVAVDHARSEAASRGVSERLSVREMNAESLELPDGSFDLVCGSGILHHLELDRALDEIARVLRPTGAAVFYEPLGHNPVVNAYRRATPDERTDDEHPILEADLVGLRDRFGEVEARGFVLTALAALALRGRPGFEAARTSLGAVDRALFSRWGRLQRWCWIVVLELGAPRAPHRSSR